MSTDKKSSPATLSFHFTPVGSTRSELNASNPHAKATGMVAETVSDLEGRFGDTVQEVTEYAGEQTVRVAKGEIRAVCTFLKEEKGFNYLADLGGIDRFCDDDRYEVFYNLVSLGEGKRLRLVTRIDEDEMSVDSMCSVYRAANWNERECFDMFGIRFTDHPDLRRMYMPEDFEYYPLRKEFPLLGVPGSLPLPPQSPEASLTLDPFPAAHGSRPVNSYEEAESELPPES